MRKKPPGQLLRGAHQVEREHRVMAALADTHVPVPRMHHLCEREGIIGTPFFVMEHVPGRTCAEPGLPGIQKRERAGVWLKMARVLARLHDVDWRLVGLGGLDLVAEGLPSRDEVVASYASGRGIAPPEHLDYFTAFALFRLIPGGIMTDRLQTGEPWCNASNADARSAGERAGYLAEHGWAIASRL